MAYEFNHVHIKASDPKKAADWYVKAFNFRILGELTLASGATAVRCATADGVPVNISGAGGSERLGPGDAGLHWGLEHFGITVDDTRAEVDRLADLGAELDDGPTEVPGGPIIAFLKAPGDVRVELVQPR